MKPVLSARSRSYRGVPPPVSYGLLALVSIGASIATAQSGGALIQRLDSIAGAGVRQNRAVGIVAAVVKGKDTLLLKAYGRADVEGDVPMTVDTVLQIGSTTKQFTAAAILQLRDQGKLSLDDDITKWLPDFETRGNKVTLRHLLGHTSGISDLGQMAELRAMQLMRNPTATRDDVYKVMNRYPFMFPTWTMEIYSSTDGCRNPPGPRGPSLDYSRIDKPIRRVRAEHRWSSPSRLHEKCGEASLPRRSRGDGTDDGRCRRRCSSVRGCRNNPDRRAAGRTASRSRVFPGCEIRCSKRMRRIVSPFMNNPG